MEELSNLDTLVYLLITVYCIISESGPLAFLSLLRSSAFYNFLVLPLDVFLNRIVKPFEFQPPFSQRCTCMEYTVSKALKHSLQSIHTPNDPSTVFFSPRVHRLFYLYRAYRQGFQGLGDIIYSDSYGNVNELSDESDSESLQPVPGLWIKSKSRSNSNHDLILYYIPNGAFIVGGPNFYVEFLSTFLVLLEQQGFQNPAVFLPELPKVPNAMFPRGLFHALKGWQYITESNPSARTVLCGDSTGATLALSLLLFIGTPDFSIFSDIDDAKDANCPVPPHPVSPLGLVPDKHDDDNLPSAFKITKKSIVRVENTNLKLPDTALIISPVLNYFITEQDSTESNYNSDYITPQLIRQWQKLFIPEQLTHSPKDGYHSPGLCTDQLWWAKSFPPAGMILSYGSEEYFRPELDQFSKLIKSIGRTKVDCHEAHVHSWPLLLFYTEKTPEDREESVFMFSGIISRMLLWHTESYLALNSREPVNVLTIDDDHT
ncbi:BA75_04646T0 [Komagataella pastoris]|uniref:BA75_04646T0 n=1 Tax=Komagataella pastoris TaxID=4922 RepID=A0A1B2JJ32_PICPA|nr:BA75_04646T0 [Komagataella pastoris]